MTQQAVVEYLTENCDLNDLFAKTRSAINIYFFQRDAVAPSNEDRAKGRKAILSDMKNMRISGVLSLLHFRDEIIQEQAILHIIQRSVKDNVEIREKGGLKPIVDLLNSSHPAIQLQAAKALSVMISYDEVTLGALPQLNAITIIVNNLVVPSSHKLQNFLQFITYNLSLYEHNWESLRRAGAIPAVCSILGRSGDESSQKMALKIISILSEDGQNRKEVLLHGGLQKAVLLLAGETPNYDAIKMLVHFSRTDEGCALILNNGGVQSLVRLLSSLKYELDTGVSKSLPLQQKMENLDLISKAGTSSASGPQKPTDSKVQPGKVRKNSGPPPVQKKKGMFKRLLSVLDKSEVSSTTIVEEETISPQSDQAQDVAPTPAAKELPTDKDLQNSLLFLLLKVIRNLSRNEACKAAIGQQGGAASLMKYTFPQIPKEYKIKALKALSSLSSNDTNKEVILSLHPIHLLALITCLDDKYFITTASIITNLADSEEFITSIGIDHLMSLLLNLKNTIPVVQQVILQLVKKCAQNEAFKNALVRNGYIKILVDILWKTQHEKVLTELVMSLCVLGEFPEIRKALSLAHIAPRLIELLNQNSNVKLQAPIVRLVYILTEGSVEDIRNILQIPGVMQLLISLMYKPLMSKYACKAANNLLLDEYIMLDFVKGGGMDTVLFLLFSKLVDVKMVALAALYKLSQSRKLQLFMLKLSVLNMLREAFTQESNSDHHQFVKNLQSLLSHLQEAQNEHAQLLARSSTIVSQNTVWLKVFHTNFKYIRLLKISVNISLGKLCQLVESVFDEGRTEAEQAQQDHARTTKLLCNDGLSTVEIRGDAELHYILESCVKGGSSVMCEAVEECEELEQPIFSPRPELTTYSTKPVKRGDVVRPRTPDNLKLIRNTLMRDAFEKMRQQGLAESEKAAIFPPSLGAEIKTAAKKRKSAQKEEAGLIDNSDSQNPQPNEVQPVKQLTMQVIMEGKKTWETDIVKWAKDVQRIFTCNVRMIRLVFNFVDASADYKSFTEVLNFAKNSPLPVGGNVTSHAPSAHELADWLIDLGFSVRYSKYSIKDEKDILTEVVEPDIIIKPPNIPTKYLLKSMLIILK